ncbi:PREDICTED: E3 ubiquitin-protein ligase RNF6-like [Tarenaya hassleriana]|uniref:E3 ubiquitin-protein ligase RNF6-like n=1 Tax=Tarenaya hassleriana TaxID=28532 RepID=UPI00053C7691|nr:PREDICTED: E3 ubiquitin-protein ligase RNF6-like [Tarenaya hassleriana]
MDSTPVFLLHEHKLEQSDEVTDFTIRFDLKTSDRESDSDKRSFSFPLGEFIDESFHSQEKLEFCFYFIESLGEDRAVFLLEELSLLARNVRAIVGRELRAVLTLSATVLVCSDELSEAIRESFDESKAWFKPATESAIGSLGRRRIEEKGLVDETCMICLDDFVFGQEVTSLPCFHEFHDGCVVKWLERSHVCPLCRFQLHCEPGPEPEGQRLEC